MATNRILDIIPECFVDTNLVTYLLGCEVNHQYGCNQVANTMKKVPGDFRLGIIDDDKRKNKYVSEFRSIARSANLELLKHSTNNHYIILVKKAAEDFILKAAEVDKVDLSEADLPNDLEGLKLYTKSCKANTDTKLRKAFKLLRDNSEFVLLKSILKYFADYKYNANEQELRSMFEK